MNEQLGKNWFSIKITGFIFSLGKEVLTNVELDLTIQTAEEAQQIVVNGFVGKAKYNPIANPSPLFSN